MSFRNLCPAAFTCAEDNEPRIHLQSVSTNAQGISRNKTFYTITSAGSIVVQDFKCTRSWNPNSSHAQSSTRSSHYPMWLTFITLPRVPHIHYILPCSTYSSDYHCSKPPSRYPFTSNTLFIYLIYLLKDIFCQRPETKLT